MTLLYEALRGGQWALAVSLIIAALVWVGRAVAPTLLPARRAAWAAAMLGASAGVGGAVGQSLPADFAGWLAAVEQGLRTGGGAALLWSLALKHLRRAEKETSDGKT